MLRKHQHTRSAWVLLITLATGVAAWGQGGMVDPRLRNPVTVSHLGTPLRESLEELSQQTSVTLSAEEALVERRIVLLARETSLGAVMAQLARLLGTHPGKCTWVRQRQGDRFRYHLVEDLASKNARRAKLAGRSEQIRHRLEELLELSKATDEEVVALREREPRLAGALASCRPFYDLVRGLTPAQRDFVSRGGVLDLSYHDLTPGQQTTVRKVLSDIQYVVRQRQPDGAAVSRPYDGRVDFASTRLQITRGGDPERPGVRVKLPAGDSAAVVCPDLLRPPIWDPEESRPDWLREGLAKEKEAEERQRARRLKGPRPPRDPVLLQPVTIRRLIRIRSGSRLDGEERERFCSSAEILLQIAEQTGLHILADYDPGFQDYYGRQWFRRLEEDLVEVPLWKALDTMASVFGVEWEKQDGWLRVRSPRAIFAMAGEIDLTPPWEALSQAPSETATTGEAEASPSGQPPQRPDTSPQQQ